MAKHARRSARMPLLVLATLLATAGCAAMPGPLGVQAGPRTTFRLGAEPVEAPATVPATVPVAAAAVPVGVTPDAPSTTHVDAGPGQVRVDFAFLLARRYGLMATTADIDRIRITLKGSEDGMGLLPFPDVAATIDRPTITAGVTSHTFTGLRLGSYEITVEALDAAGKVLGARRTSALLADATPVEVDLRINLPPTILAPAPAPSGSGSGGSGSASGLGGSGSLTADLAFADGLALTPLPLANTYPTTRQPRGMTVDGTHERVWILSQAADVSYYGASMLEIFTTYGEKVFEAPVSNGAYGQPMVDSEGNAWFRNDAGLQKYGPDGTLLYAGAPVAGSPCAVDDQDGVWLKTTHNLAKIAKDGTVVHTSFLQPDWGQLGGVASDEAGGLWVASLNGSAGTVIDHVDGAGTRLSRLTLSPNSAVTPTSTPWVLELAPDRSVWVLGVSPSVAIHLSAAGTELGRYALRTDFSIHSYGITIDADGNAWLLEPSDESTLDEVELSWGTTISKTEHVTKVAPDGTLLGHFVLAPLTNIGDIAFDRATDRLYATDMSTGRLIKTDPLP